MSKTVVFIHGLFQNPAIWESWIGYFQARGYQCHAPAYPYHEGKPADLRANVDPHLGKLTFGQVVDHLCAVIDQLPERPILIGHSVGGLSVQKLIGLNRGVAGACIDSAPPRGILTPQWSFIKSLLPVLNPFAGDSVFMPSVPWYNYAFCNTMTMEQTAQELDRYVIPESRNIPRSTLRVDGAIDFRKPHAPLLIIAGEKDNIVPASLNQRNFAAYEDASGIKAFVEFAGRTHYICGQENWEEVAEYIHGWLQRLP